MKSSVRQNIEIKARCRNLPLAKQRAMELGAEPRGTLNQIDTYLNVGFGRLKLRTSDGAPAELIFYDREDRAQPRASNYRRVPVSDPVALLDLLAAALGTHISVRKTRELLSWKTVRFHLDTVEHLGTFVELEAVVGPDADPDESRRRLDRVLAVLRIEPRDLIAASYADLLSRQSDAHKPL